MSGRPPSSTSALEPPIRRPAPPASTTPTGSRRSGLPDARRRLTDDAGDRSRGDRRINSMEGSTSVKSWLRCYRCWSQNLEVQVHYEGIHRIDPDSGERGDVVDEMQEAVVQCLECMHDQPHLGFHNGRSEER